MAAPAWAIAAAYGVHHVHRALLAAVAPTDQQQGNGRTVNPLA
jgi:hypothetical protein